MRKFINHMIIAVSSALLLISCSKGNNEELGTSCSPLSFKVRTAGLLDVKAIPKEDDVTDFTVAGYYEDGRVFFGEQSVKTGILYPEAQWENNVNHIFYGYSNLPDVGASCSVGSDGVALEFTVLPDDDDQADAVLGFYSGPGHNGTAPMTFYHPLASVQFKVGNIRGIKAITGISITGVYAAGETTLSNDTVVDEDGVAVFEWNDCSGVADLAQTVDVSEITIGADIGDPFIIIPQILESRSISVDVDIILSDDSPKVLTAELKEGEFVAGRTTNINIIYDAGDEGADLYFTAELAPWTERAVSRDIPLNSETINCHDYVVICNADGTFLKWATMNIGATSITGAGSYGDLYSWGEIETKEDYSESQYSGTRYDVAESKWGKPWRMPSSSEFISLMNATYWQWDEADLGVYVYLPNPIADAGKYNDGAGTYNKSSALLFFPAAGYSEGTSVSERGVVGRYWSNWGYSDYSLAEASFFDQNSRKLDVYYEKYIGQSVRPVSD